MMYGFWDMKRDKQNFLCHFGLLFALLPPNNPKSQNFEKLKKISGSIIILHKYIQDHDHMLYCSLDMARNGFNCYFSFWVIFCPFISLAAQKIKIKKKWKKIQEISSFHNCVPKIMIICYTSPERWCVMDVIIFHFGLFFALLPLCQPKKSKFYKNEKKLLEISSFYTSVPKIMIICYTVPKIWYVTDVIVIFRFGLFFAFLPT